MASKLTQSNRAGPAFAWPVYGFISLFIVIPFFFAFGLPLTNQRLISPNPTEFVGLANYHDLLCLSMVSPAPERDDAAQIVKDPNGGIQSPRKHNYTRKEPGFFCI